MRFEIVLAALAILAGCSDVVPSEQALEKTPESELLQTKELLMAQAPSGTRAFAVCGASHGQAFYVDSKETNWIADKISKGRFAFMQAANGDWDYIFLDATGRVGSAVGEGGQVTRVYEARNGQDAVFTVAYPDTGIVETYNLTSDFEGGRLALWTSNKAVTVVPAKVSAFLASCISG